MAVITLCLHALYISNYANSRLMPKFCFLRYRSTLLIRFWFCQCHMSIQPNRKEILAVLRNFKPVEWQQLHAKGLCL